MLIEWKGDNLSLSECLLSCPFKGGSEGIRSYCCETFPLERTYYKIYKQKANGAMDVANGAMDVANGAMDVANGTMDVAYCTIDAVYCDPWMYGLST